jgi:YD repeat-containing protein
MTDALGNCTEYRYDAAGNETAVIDPLGIFTRYEYDDLNRRTRTIYDDGTSETVLYDLNETIAERTDQNGRATRAHDAVSLQRAEPPVGGGGRAGAGNEL